MTEQEEAVVRQMLDGAEVPEDLAELLNRAKNYGDKVTAGAWPIHHIAALIAVYMMDRPPVLEYETEEGQANSVAEQTVEIDPSVPTQLTVPPRNRGGRPPGSKNKPKAQVESYV